MSLLSKTLVAASCSVILGTAFISTQVHAEVSDKQAKNAVEFRQSIFQLIRSNIGPLGAMAKGKAPIDEAVIAKNALRIEQLSLMISDYFVLDTRSNDVESGALPKIWDNQSEFTQKADDLTQAAKALLLIVANKDEANYRKGIGAVGATCTACHDDYKAD